MGPLACRAIWMIWGENASRPDQPDQGPDEAAGSAGALSRVLGDYLKQFLIDKFTRGAGESLISPT